MWHFTDLIHIIISSVWLYVPISYTIRRPYTTHDVVLYKLELFFIVPLIRIMLQVSKALHYCYATLFKSFKFGYHLYHLSGSVYLHSRHHMLTHCCINVGPPSATLSQHYFNNLSTCRVSQVHRSQSRWMLVEHNQSFSNRITALAPCPLLTSQHNECIDCWAMCLLTLTACACNHGNNWLEWPWYNLPYPFSTPYLICVTT